MTVSNNFKSTILEALFAARKNYDVREGQYARIMGLTPTKYSLVKNGKTDSLTTADWVNLSRKLNVNLNKKKWNVVKTDVYMQIEEEVLFCKQYSKAFMFVDDTGIGKTFTLKHLSLTLQNAFYLDCRQTPQKREFIRAIARAVGVHDRGHSSEIREDIKAALQLMMNPVFMLDEFGALEDMAVQFFLELWNGTENSCGWYLCGADGLRAKVEGHIGRRRVGWAELFSRCNERYNRVTPVEPEERKAFFKKLIHDVLDANMEDKKEIPKIVNKCLTNDSGRISGLRRAETFKILSEEV